MASPVASVVVAVKDDCRVYRLVRSLLAQTAPPDAFEVIVVENGSARLGDVVSGGAGRVRYLHLPQGNMAAARDRGLAAAGGRYTLLTDADCVADPSWVEHMIAGLEQGRLGAVGGRINRLDGSTWVQRYARTIVDGQLALSYLPALGLPYVAGANAGFVTAALRAVGGFDHRFKSGNDVDVCYRLGMAGHRIGLAPDAIVLHDDRADVGAHFHRFRHYAVFQVLLFAKYRSLSGKRYVINPYPVHQVAEAIRRTPRVAFGLLIGDNGPFLQTVLQIVEAAGVWAGDVEPPRRQRFMALSIAAGAPSWEGLLPLRLTINRDSFVFASVMRRGWYPHIPCRICPCLACIRRSFPLSIRPHQSELSRNRCPPVARPQEKGRGRPHEADELARTRVAGNAQQQLPEYLRSSGPGPCGNCGPGP